MFYLTLSRSTKKLLLLVLSALFAYWLLLAQATCSASEMYQISEREETRIITLTELSILQEKLSEVSQINGKLQNELTDWRTSLNLSQNELKRAKQELAAAQEELRMLRAEYLLLKEKSTSQEQRLKIANESLKKSAAELKRERLRIKAQRNAWTVIACGAVVAAIGK